MIGRPDFDAVKSGFLATYRSGHKGGDQFLNFSFGHRVTTITIVIARHTGRPPMRLIAQIRVAMLTNVIELLKDNRASVFDGFQYFSERRYDGIVFSTKISACKNPSAMNGNRFSDDHRCAAQSAL